MGFSTANEILAATNGVPLLSFTIPFFNLTNYTGPDFDELLQPQPQTQLRFRAIVPVMVGTNIRSSLTLRPAQGPGGGATPPAVTQWVEGDWGRPEVIRSLIATYRAVTNANLQLPGTVPFAVEVLIPRVWLVGYKDRPGGKLVLLAIVDLHLAGGVSIPQGLAITSDAMKQFRDAARRYNRNLPN